MASLLKEEPQVAIYFQDAKLEIDDAHVLKEVIDGLDSFNFTKLGPDVKGDIFEYLLQYLSESMRDLLVRFLLGVSEAGLQDLNSGDHQAKGDLVSRLEALAHRVASRTYEQHERPELVGECRSAHGGKPFRRDHCCDEPRRTSGRAGGWRVR